MKSRKAVKTIKNLHSFPYIKIMLGLFIAHFTELC